MRPGQHYWKQETGATKQNTNLIYFDFSKRILEQLPLKEEMRMRRGSGGLVPLGLHSLPNIKSFIHSEKQPAAYLQVLSLHLQFAQTTEQRLPAEEEVQVLLNASGKT